MPKSEYKPAQDRYTNSAGFNRCGKSGLMLPKISLGLWHNFGDIDDQKEALNMLKYAFDHGITHFDLANNYGTPFGSAETNFGKILKNDFSGYRDEMIISSKAGHIMWPGPYGDGGSRKYLMASLDQSLKRMQLDYVDIFYSHRYDPNTPLEETMGALSDIVKQGKAQYVGISKYPADVAREAYRILRSNGTPCLINQDRYNIFTDHSIYSIIASSSNSDHDNFCTGICFCCSNFQQGSSSFISPYIYVKFDNQTSLFLLCLVIYSQNHTIFCVF
jgi:L-glyceraldehyde 3-phosphate reductase